jgi:hypothetical protein
MPTIPMHKPAPLLQPPLVIVYFPQTPYELVSPVSTRPLPKSSHQVRRLRFAGGGGGGGFLAREGGGGGGPFFAVDAVLRFAKLPCEVAGETDLTPYDR